MAEYVTVWQAQAQCIGGPIAEPFQQMGVGQTSMSAGAQCQTMMCPRLAAFSGSLMLCALITQVANGTKPIIDGDDCFPEGASGA